MRCFISQAPGQDHLYLVGTEEGNVHKCSKAYSSDSLTMFAGHTMTVYAVRYNHIHHRMFLSASADWTVRLWDSKRTDKPVMKFDLGDSVGKLDLLLMPCQLLCLLLLGLTATQRILQCYVTAPTCILPDRTIAPDLDLLHPAGDIAWAPFSASIFAAVTDDGKVHIFDVAENRLAPLCVQKISKKKLTKVAFNPNVSDLQLESSRWA